VVRRARRGRTRARHRQAHGPFWLILDSVGGTALRAALGMLQLNGTCVTFGASETSTVSVGSRDFFAVGGTRLYGLTLFHELMSVERAGIGLGLLADLITAKKLRPQIAVEAPWGEIGAVAQRLIERDFTGKAVLHIYEGRRCRGPPAGKAATACPQNRAMTGHALHSSTFALSSSAASRRLSMSGRAALAGRTALDC
jgi:Zinc-binding dehydrogenase